MKWNFNPYFDSCHTLTPMAIKTRRKTYDLDAWCYVENKFVNIAKNITELECGKMSQQFMRTRRYKNVRI